jgi:hypothetical protein
VYVENKKQKCVYVCVVALALQGVAFEDVVLKVLTAGGPINKASIQPEYVRLHDDKVSTLTRQHLMVFHVLVYVG